MLARGYGWTTDASGRLVRSIRGIATGDLVTTRLADGTFDATVGPVHDEAAPGMAGDDGAG